MENKSYSINSPRSHDTSHKNAHHQLKLDVSQGIKKDSPRLSVSSKSSPRGKSPRIIEPAVKESSSFSLLSFFTRSELSQEDLDKQRITKAWEHVMPSRLNLCIETSEKYGIGIHYFRALFESERSQLSKILEYSIHYEYRFIAISSPLFDAILIDEKRDYIDTRFDEHKHLIIVLEIPDILVQTSENANNALIDYANVLSVLELVDTNGNIIEH